MLGESDLRHRRRPTRAKTAGQYGPCERRWGEDRIRSLQNLDTLDIDQSLAFTGTKPIAWIAVGALLRAKAADLLREHVSLGCQLETAAGCDR